MVFYFFDTLTLLHLLLLLGRITMQSRRGTGSHFVTQRPSDLGIQRPGDPVDPVTLLYNKLQISTCCRQTFAMGKRFASFYRCLALARFWKVKFRRSFIKCQYFNDCWTDFHKNIYLYFGLFFKNWKISGHTRSK